MNPDTLKMVRIESDRRCSAEELETILRNTPIIIATKRNTELRARMGLGKIIYIELVKGQIKDVKLGQNVEEDVSRSGKDYLVFEYKQQRYEIRYH